MTEMFVASDVAVIDLLRKHSSLSVADMATSLRVTPTAIRQRLSRLLAHGYIIRNTVRTGRGRPTHQYSLTEVGRRKSGANFADLAIALWDEIRSIRDPEVRRGLLQRVSRRLAEAYADRLHGRTLDERMASLAALFQSRQIPFEVEQKSGLPVLHARACPYPGLAENDRGICAMERLLFEELLGTDLALNDCRLDGGNCCTFEVRERAAMVDEADILRRRVETRVAMVEATNHPVAGVSEVVLGEVDPIEAVGSSLAAAAAVENGRGQ